MAEIINMPRLSDTMEEGTVATWLKKVGDKVEEGDILAEIETDKATMEFESFHDGVLLHIGVQEGETTKVDALLAIIGEKGEDIKAILADAAKNAAVEEVKIEATPEPAKPAPVVATPTPAPVQVSTPAPAAVKDVKDSNGRVNASPLAKKMADDKGIDLTLVSGTGEGGRIVKRDVENYVPYVGAASKSRSFVGVESYTDEPISQMRKTIAKRLAESKFTAPHFYLTIAIDMDNAIDIRTSINEHGGVKISYNDMVIKACALALREHPAVNSSWLGDVIRRNQHVHIGVAVVLIYRRFRLLSFTRGGSGRRGRIAIGRTHV